MDRVCADCIFAHCEEVADKSVLTCRRYAPRPFDLIKPTQWPMVNPYYWCGEFLSDGVRPK